MLGPPAIGERLYVRDGVAPRAVSDRVPARHVRSVEAVLERSLEIGDERQRSGGRRAALEDAGPIVARPRIFVSGCFAATVALLAVTRHAVAVVDVVTLLRITRVV